MNLVSSGTFDAKGDVNSLNASLSNTFAYKLRGRYANGTSSGIFIAGPNLHHTFTVTTWVLLEALDHDNTIFSKEKGGDYVIPDAENLLEF